VPAGVRGRSDDRSRHESVSDGEVPPPRGVLGYDTDPHGPCLARGAAIA
jgi:hypothetical protein